MKPEEFEVYVIPPNFMEGGTLFGGLLKTRNTIEAVILGLAVGVPVLHLPFSLTVRVVILCLTALPLVLLALIGVSGMSLSAFIRLFFCFLHNRRILSRDGTQGGKNGKTLLPSWAQQRKSDCEAEDPPLPKSRSRFSVDLKQRSVTQFKTFLQEEEAVQPLNALADYIPIEKIEHGVIYTRDHRYVTGGEERDHFWDSAEMNLLKALVLYVSTSYPKKKQNIGEVYQLLTASSEKELNALFDVLPLTHPAKAPYSIFKQASEGVRGGVIIGLGSRLQVFQNRDIRNITSYNEIDLELPGKQPCAYYCITSDQDSTFDFLSSLFLSFVFIRLVRYADEHCPGGELPVPVHVLGEELCACGVIPDLSRKISVIRSRNLSMSCVFQNLAGLQNRYPFNQWQEILGNCDVQLFLGCTDALTAEFISDRTGEASISVTSKAKQLGTWRVSNYTPEYRETSGVGRRKLMTMDEVLRMDIDKALILIRGKNVLEVDKYDYFKHPEAKKLRSSKAASHVPAWRANQPQEKQTPSAPPSQAAEKKPAQKKKPAPAEKVVAVTKESIMKKKEDT